MSATRTRNPLMQKDRLEFFSDGVFAIAITLLVLEIKIPSHEQLHHAGGLFNYLLHIWPAYLSYVLSFLTIGVYWTNHHHLFSFIIKKSDHYFNLINIIFLMTIAFIPFTTAVFGDYYTDHENSGEAVTIFCLGFAFPPISLIPLFLYLKYKTGIADPDLAPAFINKQIIKISSGVAFSLTALAVSFWYPMVSFAMILGGFVIYFMPPDMPVYTSGREAREE